MKKTRRWLPIIIITILLFLFGGGLVHFHFNRPLTEMKTELLSLSETEYEAIFLSMYPISGYSEDDFSTYRGLKTNIIKTPVTDLFSLSQLLDAALSSGNNVSHIYLGLDPKILWENSLEKESQWEKHLKRYLFSHMDAHPDITFELLLPSPYLSYWTSLADDELTKTLTCYASLGNAILHKPNGFVYFTGAEEWLFRNKDNYLSDPLTLTDQLCKKIFLLNFCDQMYLMDENTLVQKIETLQKLIVQEKASPSKYPDLSQMYFVYLGDSVMVYDSGSCSIPGVAKALSGAEYANLSQGGTPASGTLEDGFHLISMVAALHTADPSTYQGKDDFYKGLQKFLSDQKDPAFSQKDLCFVISLGLNDYFSGFPVSNPEDPYDVSSYAGTLRYNLSLLQKDYPDARILLLTPNYCSAFTGGTEILSENGGVLTDYVTAALGIASELGCDFLDIYTQSGINEATCNDYLADGVHPNETGRFLIGNAILEHFQTK